MYRHYLEMTLKLVTAKFEKLPYSIDIENVKKVMEAVGNALGKLMIGIDLEEEWREEVGPELADHKPTRGEVQEVFSENDIFIDAIADGTTM